MLTVLDNILLSNEVVKNFHTEYDKPEFKNWLITLLPEIEDCANTDQDNPWHIYNVLDHILHSIEEMNKQTKDFDLSTRRMLAYTMLMHDIGKPKCKIRRYSKKYGRVADSFFNHNLAGVEIADRVLGDFNFDDLEREIIKTLIKEHDVFMFIRLEDNNNPYHHTLTQDYIRELISNLDKTFDGYTMMKYLLLVGRSDNLAQNPEMTSDSLHLLNVMTEMLQDQDIINISKNN